MRDRRHFNRKSLPLEVELFHAGVKHPATLYARDISLGGVFLETHGPVDTPIGAEVELVLRRSGDDSSSHAIKGNVARVGENGLGLIFQRLELEYFSFLERLLAPAAAEDI